MDLRLVGDGLHTIPATVRRVTNGVFELCSPVYLRPGRQLTMWHAEGAMESRVAYCNRQERSYNLGILLARDADRRSETRTPVDLPALLHIAGSLTAIPVRVIDLSVSGLGLELPTAIALGASVRVELGTGTAIGEIRHCEGNSAGFRAGIRMSEFVLPANAQRMVIRDATRQTGGATALASLTHAIQERQSRYEAILYSLAQLR